MNPDTLGIVGAGAFGTALGHHVARSGRDVLLWSRNDQVVDEINERHTNERRLPGVELSPNLRATADPARLAERARLVILAVASTDARNRAQLLGELLAPEHLVVHAIGALATPGDVRVSDLLLEELPVLRVGVLAGPALPADLVAGQFASMVVASRFAEVVEEARRLIAAPPALRLYGGHDLVGVELAGALAGAYTVAVGISDALAIGPGPRAVLVTRVVAEATRLCVAAGGDVRTFAGLAGLGNLLVRSSPESSEHSIAYRFGLALGRGERTADARETEGGRAAVASVRLARGLGVRVPVLSALAAVMAGELSPREAAAAAGDTVASEE